MRGFYWVIILTVLLGCNVSESTTEFVYDWERVAQFEQDQITAIHISNEDELYVATGRSLFKSFEIHSLYTRMQSPDSADIVRIRTFEDRILLVGNVFQSDIGNFGGEISYIYQSTDDGATWQELIGGFVMQDVTYHDNRIHIGRTHGVTTLDLVTNTIITNRLIDSRISDHMEEIEVSMDGKIVVACHEGVFISENNGQDWVEIATEIQKDDDWIRSIEFSGDELFALELSRVYRINLISGEVETNKGFTGYEQLELTNTGELIKLGSSKLGVANQNNLDFEDIFPVNVSNDALYLNFVDSFSDGTLAITASEKLFIVERVQ